MQKQNNIFTFTEKVKRVVRSIPKGSVLSYKEVAVQAGSPNAYRAVASVMAKNFDPTVPCHRVIKSDGSPGEYNRGGTQAKYAILTSEGVQLPYDSK